MNTPKFNVGDRVTFTNDQLVSGQRMLINTGRRKDRSMKENGTYHLEHILRDVAMACRASGDCSATTIRCAINDALDYWDKGGFKVNFDYAQERAIARVKKLIREL